MSDEVRYQTGFGNEFATEAVAGGLPQGQNAPQKHPLGLYTEQFSGTPFTAPRATNRRTWTYRIRPSVTHRPYEEIPVKADSQRSISRGSHLAQSTTLGPFADSQREDRLRRRHCDAGWQRRPGHAGRRRHSSLRRQLLHAGPLLLHRRRRVADRPSTWRASLSYGVGNS